MVGPVNPYREPAPIPRERFGPLDWDDAALIVLEQARRAHEEATDYYAFRHAMPSLARHIASWLSLG